MACGTVIGSGLDEDDFGLTANGAGIAADFLTQTTDVVRKKDRKEARNACGDVVNLAYYNLTADISISAYGDEQALTIGGALSISSGLYTNDFASMIPSTSAVVVKEVTITRSNEDFVKTDIKAMSYEGITAL